MCTVHKIGQNRAHIHMYNKVEQTFKCTTGEAIKKMQNGKSDVERGAREQ